MVTIISHAQKTNYGINEQPVGRRENIKGGENRAKDYKVIYADEIASSSASDKFLVSMENGIFFSLRKFGIYDRTIAYVENLNTHEGTKAIFDGVRLPWQDVRSVFFKEDGVKKNTVGQSITQRLGGDHQDARSRNVFLYQAAEKAIRELPRN